MKHASQVRYPASSDVVIRMITDKAYHIRKLDHMGVDYAVLSHAFDGDDFTLRIQRQISMQARGVLAKVVAGKTHVVSEEHWRISDKTGAITVDTGGMPLDISCEARLYDEGGECVVDFLWHVRAKLPVGGKALEKLVVVNMAQRVTEELDAALQMLEGDQ